MTSRISLRPVSDEDKAFLSEVYASTRREEMSALPWSNKQKTEFLKMQFEAQDHHYREHFPKASFDIILLEGLQVGRLYTDRRQDEIRVIDIALLPEHQGKGIGGGIMKGLIAEATAASKAVRIHVEQNNPALGLYRRLGFRKIDETGVYFLMERPPGP